MRTKRSMDVAKSVLVGIGVSVPITLLGALAGFPVALYLLPIMQPLGLFGPVVAFALCPVLANLFIWRAFMSHSSRPTQISLLTTGMILSLVVAIVFFVGLFFGMLSDA